MKFLQLDYIRQHSRICCDCENEILELYGTAAEDTVLNILGRTVGELEEIGGGSVPAPVVQAALLLTDNSYQNRTPCDPQNKAAVPYTFDCLLLPYIKL